MASLRPPQLDEIVDVARAKGQLSVSVAALDALRKSWADARGSPGMTAPPATPTSSSTSTRGPTINIIVDRLLAIVEDLPDEGQDGDCLLDSVGACRAVLLRRRQRRNSAYRRPVMRQPMPENGGARWLDGRSCPISRSLPTGCHRRSGRTAS